MLLKTATTRSERKTLLSKLATAKASSIGGDQEAEFEQSLAQLALNYIQDKAPKLMDAMVGFQLVERNDDSTKAVGVFGFRLGQRLVYGPIFYINGELHGHEMLYDKESDTFVPLSEDWVNYLLSQNKQPDIGSPVMGSPRELGVTQPDIRPLSQPPFMGKRSAQIFPNVPTAGWLSPSKGFRGAYCALTQPTASKSAAAGIGKNLAFETGDVLNSILRLSPGWTKRAMDICDQYPAIGRYWRQFHGHDVFERALLDQRERVKQALSSSVLGASPTHTPVGSPGGVRLITDRECSLSDKEAAALGRQGHVILDDRSLDNLSEAFVRGPQRLINPNKTGLYKLLTKPGTFANCLIIVGPKGQFETNKEAIVVHSDGDGRGYLVSDIGNLFVTHEDANLNAWHEWFDKLDSSDLTEGDEYVLVDRTGEGSTVFRIWDKHEGGRYEVSRCACNTLDMPDWKRPAFPDGEPYNNRYDYRRKPLELLEKQEGKNTAFRFFDGVLQAPGDSKAIRVTPAHDLIVPGDIVDAEIGLRKKTASLQLLVSGPEASINRGRPQTKLAALWSLVSEHGFSEPDARVLLKQAETAGRAGNGVSFYVRYGPGYGTNKQAYSGALDGGGISSPAIPDPMMNYSQWAPGAMEQRPLEQETPVEGVGARYNDPSIYDPSPENQPDPMLMQQAQQAGQSNQKEMFDTTMLSGMLKNVRQNTLVQTYSKDLFKALDRLGRILFLFWWHNEEFADRYGKSDLPELEDGLRNSFETVGDLALFLKEKDVEPLGNNQLGEASVDDVAG